MIRPERQWRARRRVFARASVLPTTFGTTQGGLNGAEAEAGWRWRWWRRRWRWRRWRRRWWRWRWRWRRRWRRWRRRWWRRWWRGWWRRRWWRRRTAPAGIHRLRLSRRGRPVVATRCDEQVADVRALDERALHVQVVSVRPAVRGRVVRLRLARRVRREQTRRLAQRLAGGERVAAAEDVQHAVADTCPGTLLAEAGSPVASTCWLRCRSRRASPGLRCWRLAHRLRTGGVDDRGTRPAQCVGHRRLR